MPSTKEGSFILFFLFYLLYLLYYSFPSIYTNLFDKVAILFVVCYGAYLFSFKHPFQQFVISLTFLCTILFFFFGYLTPSVTVLKATIITRLFTLFLL